MSTAIQSDLLRQMDSGRSIRGRGQGIGEREGSLARKRFQSGTLILRNEKWLGRWYEDVIGIDGVTRRVRRAVVLGTEKELETKKLARRRLQECLAKVNAPTYRPERRATFGEFVKQWRTDVLVHRKPSTVRAAEWHLKRYLLPHFETINLESIGAENQQKFVGVLSRKLSRKSVLNVVGTLSAILRTAKAWRYNCTPVDFQALTLPAQAERRRARFFSAEEAKGIIAASPEPFATAFAVAAMTAVRPGELFALKWEDLDFDRKLIFIRRSVWYGKMQAPKSNSSVRALPLPEALVERLQKFLKSWRPNPLNLLFASSRGTPMSANNVVQRKLWPVLDQLGVRRCGLHAFRHTHSSLLVDTGAPATVAQAQLGHSDPRVTLGVYCHLIGDAHRNAVEKVARRILDSSGLTPGGSAKWVQ